MDATDVTLEPMSPAQAPAEPGALWAAEAWISRVPSATLAGQLPHSGPLGCVLPSKTTST
jgi:hypothetical protein